jgi:hypothetical protein
MGVRAIQTNGGCKKGAIKKRATPKTLGHKSPKKKKTKTKTTF